MVITPLPAATLVACCVEVAPSCAGVEEAASASGDEEARSSEGNRGETAGAEVVAEEVAAEEKTPPGEDVAVEDAVTASF